MADYRIGRETYHYMWSRDHKPVLTVKQDDTVLFDINDVSSWQINEKTEAKDLKKLDGSKLYPLAGPVYVEGAEKGDTLVVEVLDVKTDSFGWTAILPGLGLLEEFRKPYIYKWKVGKEYAEFENGIKIPVRPFCGVMGVAPAKKGKFEVMPPGLHGGNMDIKHLVAGSKLMLPVFVKGALFSAGDVHAAMGDGEVCVSAIECAGSALLRFGVEKNNTIASPQYYTKNEEQSKRGYFTATGISSNLMEAAKESVRNMISHLVRKYGLTKEEAYVLCSVAADMKIHEVVDRPNWVVGLSIPLDIFP